MAAKNQLRLTLADWAKRVDPDGKIPDIVELLAQTNEILSDMVFVEANGGTAHRVVVRTGLPSVFWRLLNQGVQSSKSRTQQIDEGMGMMEAYSEVDVKLVKLSGDEKAFRLSEAMAFIEAMNQEMAQTVFYGNSSASPEEFNGLSVRYADSTAANGKNVLKAGGAGSDNSSIWLIVWGQRTVHGIFPKGSKAGLDQEDLGKQTSENVNGVSGAKMEVMREHFTWDCGLCLKDWRYVVRICNIDISNLVAESSDADLIKYMIKAIHRIHNLKAGKPVFYMNRTCFEFLDIQRYRNAKAGGGITFENVDGEVIPMFRGIPIRVTDALLETEATVA